MERFADYKDHERDNWQFHKQTLKYHCGFCGAKVSSILGLQHNQYNQRMTAFFDVRLCPNCKYATNFYVYENDIRFQVPIPVPGESFHPTKEEEDLSLIVDLYNEARIAMSQGSASCAVLMFRKILMHIALEQNAKHGGFESYCNYLKDNGIVSKPQFQMLDRIKQAGNAENHEIRQATDAEARDLIELVTALIKSIYFMK